MFKYSFPSEHIVGVMMHIQAYDSIIMSMTPSDSNYVIELDKQISQVQLDHLTESYNLTEVI